MYGIMMYRVTQNNVITLFGAILGSLGTYKGPFIYYVNHFGEGGGGGGGGGGAEVDYTKGGYFGGEEKFTKWFK